MHASPRQTTRLLRSLVTLALLSAPARAQAPTSILSVALDHIDALYLDRASLTPAAVRGAVAARLEREIEWLMVDIEGDALVLRRGSEAELGRVVVSDWPGLERALLDLMALLAEAEDERTLGHTLDGAPLDVVLLKGVTDALDRHSRVLYGERLRAFDERLKGSMIGVGLTLRAQSPHGLLVEEVFPGHPAARAGVEAGDQLLRVDGVAVTGARVEDVEARLAGDPGTVVAIELARRGVEPFTVELVREEIHLPNVRHRVLDGDFGYIRIDHFSELTSQHLGHALASLDEAGALGRGLVLDLRDNTGGSMLQSARAVDAFVKAGDLLRTVGPDGGRVRGLTERIWADDDLTEPEVPIVVLQNERTASGAEILAGALRELDRAVIVGDRSYGKGTVQKVYTLDAETRLKLTVARYLLAGGVAIDERGAAPDLAVGGLTLSADGVRQRAPAMGEDDSEPVLFVHEASGWREGAAPVVARGDIPLELALRVLSRGGGASRQQLLAAVAEVRELALAEEEQRAAEAMEARGLDWSPAPRGAGRPKVRVDLSLDGQVKAGQPAEVVARVWNDGEQDLHRVALRLASADATWDGVVIPVGRVAPGQSAEGRGLAFPPVGTPTREALVYPVFAADLRPEIALMGQSLAVFGHPAPDLSLDLRLEPEGEAHRVVVDLAHEGPFPLSGVRVRLEVPESAPLELLDADAALPSIASGARAELHLGLRLLSEEPAPLPLHVVVESERYGQLLDWSLALPVDGRSVHLDAPEVFVRGLPTRSEAGVLAQPLRVTDDVSVDHVVLWRGQDKVQVLQGQGRRLDAQLSLELAPGENSFLIEAIDGQGLRSRQALYVQGVEERPVVSEDP